MEAHRPLEVIPAELVPAVADLPYWFVIGGHAVRCFCPYRPSRDVDFGVPSARDLEDFLKQLALRGNVEITERGEGTVHLRFDGVNVSVFVLANLARWVEDRRLQPTAILATKLHAILDRGARRDFFDLYVTLQQHSIGIVECLSALRTVFAQEVDDALLLRALTWFDEADREASLPGEGPHDWSTLKEFFLTRVGQLLVPPTRTLDIQKRVVDFRPGPARRGT